MIALWAIAATAAAVILAILYIGYRRQIKMVCRQLAFLKEQETNMRLTEGGVPSREINELVDGINEILDRSRQIQDAARQSEDSLKETITNLSHDIRTPLTSMDGYFQLLSQSDSEEERQHYIAVIQSRITSLGDMLEELFTYTKLQNENYELALETIDFGKCVFDTVFSFYDEFEKKGIQPEIMFCEEKLKVNGNAEAVWRLFQNVIKNALVHGKSRIRLELLRKEETVVFRCTNDVEHPEEIDARKVFARFYKADSARTKNSTGLGLSIAKGLAERMNGTMEAGLEGDEFTIEVRMRLEPIDDKQ